MNLTDNKKPASFGGGPYIFLIFYNCGPPPFIVGIRITTTIILELNIKVFLQYEYTAAVRIYKELFCSSDNGRLA